jgi:Permuted papain-like amidase enzyme, YaeF/YiiX, C92 family
MWSLIATCAIACCSPDADVNPPEPPASLVAEVQQDLQTGSLIFSQGDCLAVKIFTQSSFTHVAGVVAIGGESMVYESTNGVGVRKIPLVEYLRRQSPTTFYIAHPKVPFSKEKAQAFQQHLESQIGRAYAVRHHLTGNRCEGLHCSEYMTDALMAAELVSAKEPPRVSPGSLLEGIITSKIYREGNRIEINLPEPSQPVEQSWYQRAWDCTSSCCSKSVKQLRRWILCR